MARPAPSLPPWETLSSGAEPPSIHTAGDGTGGGGPVGDVLSWDTHIRMSWLCNSAVTLNKSPANGLVPPFSVCKGEMEQQV